MVNTERADIFQVTDINYNILNIVVNTEPLWQQRKYSRHYNILNIVVNTERVSFASNSI